MPLEFKLPAPLLCEITETSFIIEDREEASQIPLERLPSGRLSEECKARMIAALRPHLKKSWSGRRQVICAIPGRGAALRQVQLPPSALQNLRDVLALQIERDLPLGPDQVAWGYCILHPTNGGLLAQATSRQVLLAAANKELFNEYAQVFRACGIEPDITLAAVARATLCPETKAGSALLEVGHHSSELIALENGVPTTIRTLSWGYAEGTSTLASLAGLIKKTWSGSHLFVSGEIDVPEFARSLTVELGDGTLAEGLPNGHRQHASTAIGGLKHRLKHKEVIPFLSTANGRATQRKVAQQWQATAAACGAMLLLVIFLFRYSEPLLRTNALAASIARVQLSKRQLPEIDRQLGFLQHLNSNQPPCIEVISAISSAAARGTRLESFSLNRRGDFALRGTMADSQRAIELRSKLIESGLFANVVLEEQTPERNGQKVKVRMVGRWIPAHQQRLPRITGTNSPPTKPTPQVKTRN